ncbi:MAG: hypothetical protein IT426_05980 [Pirellulales bacterium]|nr:hypothetical protein [Pirellulales bacterium]
MMADEFDAYGAGMAMRNRFDGNSAHIAPRPDYALPATMAQLGMLGSILRVLNLIHVVFVAVGLLGLAYLVTYYYLIQAFGFPQDFWYLKIDELHRQMLHHPIGDRDVAYLVLFVFLFIADNVVLRAGKCMKRAEDHSMAVIGAFTACIPLLNTVSLPFGLLALILLLKPPVEKRFR